MAEESFKGNSSAMIFNSRLGAVNSNEKDEKVN